MNLTWQGFVLLNLAALIALAFWTGRQAERIDNLQTRMAKIEDEGQPNTKAMAIVTERLDNVVKSVENLATRFDDFERSESAAILRTIHTTLRGQRA